MNKPPVLNHINLSRRLANTSWIFEKAPDQDALIYTFFPHGKLLLTTSAFNAVSRVKQVFTGDETRGNWSVRATPSQTLLDGSAQMARSSVSSFSFCNRSRTLTPAPGPYLICNLTDLPKCIANFRTLGVQLNFGDWGMTLKEVLGNPNYRLLQYSDEMMRLEHIASKKVMAWRRATEPFPRHPDQDDDDNE